MLKWSSWEGEWASLKISCFWITLTLIEQSVVTVIQKEIAKKEELWCKSGTPEPPDTPEQSIKAKLIIIFTNYLHSNAVWVLIWNHPVCMFTVL